MPKRGIRDIAKEQFWRKALARFASSGKSRTAFCAEEGLTLHAMKYWEGALLNRDASKKSTKAVTNGAQSNPFIPVLIPEFDRAFPEDGFTAVAELVVAGASARLFKGIDLATTKMLLRALKETTF